MIARFLQANVVVQHRMEDIQEEMEGILVEEVNLAQRVQREEDAAASFRQRSVLLRYGLDLSYNLVRLFHLLADVGSLLFQRFERCDYRIIIKDLSFGVIQGLQQRLLQLTQTQMILSYNLKYGT